MGVSGITSYEEFRRRLIEALPISFDLAQKYPEGATRAVHEQLHMLEEWTRDGTEPTPSQKSSLSFGLIASRYIDDLDQSLAQELYALASYLIWGENGRQ